MSRYMLERRNRMLGISAPKEETKVKPIAKKSKKLMQAEREYKKIVKEMLAENTLCEMNTPNCTRVATGLQHTKRRGVNLLDRKHLIRSCNPCNLWVELHPKEALEMGIAISVHKI